MRYWLGGLLGVLAACNGESKGGDADDSGTGDGPDITDTVTDTDTTTDTDTDVTTPPDTDTTPVVTGCYDVPLTVNGGFGDTSFVPISAGDTLPLVHGPQGGWHLWSSVQVEHTHEAVQILPTVTLKATGEVISGAQGPLDLNNASVALVMTGDCAGESVGGHAFINDIHPGTTQDDGKATLAEICALDGQEATFAWTVTDLTDGRTATDSVDILIAMDPYDMAGCAGYP